VKVEVPSSASVVVIGGGVIGLSIAFHLAQAGVDDVVVVEQNTVGSGSTCKAAGGARGSFSTPSNIAMGLRGIEAFSRFQSDFDQDIQYVNCGYLYLLSDQEMVDTFVESVALQNSYGVPSRMIDPEEAKRISPLISTDGLLAASWSPGDAKATPEAVVNGYARAARSIGVKVIQQCSVKGITVSGSSIAGVTTSAGTISTHTVICAAGAWSRVVGDMVGLTLPVDPLRRHMAFTEPDDRIPHVGPLTIDFPSAFYFHPEGRGLAVGWSDPNEQIGFNHEVDLEGWMEGFVEPLAHRAPLIAELGIQSGWSGLYEVTPDQNQIIGRSTELPGFFYAAGYSGHGFQMAPATGEIIRDLYLEREPRYDIAPFDVRRFDRAAAFANEVNIV
jgi:sarcosine oxidase, subunit beta